MIYGMFIVFVGHLVLEPRRRKGLSESGINERRCEGEMKTHTDCKTKETELVNHLRETLKLSKEDANDEEILTITKGTFLRALIELRIAWQKFKKEINNAFRC